MMDFNFNWVWLAVILPVVAGFFKQEIGKIVTAFNVYRLRAFDIDGRPNTPDVVELLNNATGEWDDLIIEKFHFSFSSRTRGVFLRYPNGEREKISFLEWAKIRKRYPA